MASEDSYRCVDCGARVPRDEVRCAHCGHEHVDAEELWAIGVLSPPVFLMFAVLVLWALDTLAPQAFGVLGPRSVVTVVAALWSVAFLQFTWDHLRYRRAVRPAGVSLDPTAWLAAAPDDATEAVERLRVTVRVGAGIALVGVLGGLADPGAGYGLALTLAEAAGVGLLCFAGVSTYRLREVLRLRSHVRRTVARTARTVESVAGRVVADGRRAVTGLAPYVADVARGSRSVARDARRAAVRLEAGAGSVADGLAAAAGGADATELADALTFRWEDATASMERHWPAWGVVGVVEIWVVAFETGVGVTYLTETMLLTWLAYSYFLFEDVAVTRERYDWDPWWWAYSVAGLLPIVNIGVGATYLLRRELIRRNTPADGDDTEPATG